MSRIVVGIDGSEESKAALRWAIEEARYRDATVEVVHVHQPPAMYGYPPTSLAPELLQDTEDALRRQAGQLLDEVVGAVEPGEILVERTVLQDVGAAQALVARSRGADLLVVGSRGRGGFKGLLLGSVSQQSANHAACPVVIIRGSD